MRYIILLSLCLIAFSGFAQKTNITAQKTNITVTESTENIGGGKNPVLIASIFYASIPDIESKWRSLMKDYKAKVKSEEEIFADNAVIASINGNNTIDIHAKVVSVKNEESKIIVAFDLGGAYLSSANNKEKFSEARRLLNEFAIKVTKEAIANQRKMAEKTLASLQSDQKDLEKQQNKLNSNIVDYKAKIEDYNKRIKETEDNLVKNKAEQDKKKAEVDEQQKAVNDITARESSVE
ncbi:MAG: coiled-coil domain-containing protein [Bacteroidia bacterium]